jgi:hypothetical protein
MRIYYELASDESNMATETPQKVSLFRLLLMFLVLSFGIFTLFALVVTVPVAWQEHLQSRWPEVIAQVDTCDLTRTSTAQRQKFYIRCRLNYVVGTEHHAKNLYSRTVPSTVLWQYPPNQIATFIHWVNDHPHGSSLPVRYDPADHTKIVLTAHSMPGGWPRTPDNLKLLGFFAAGFLLLLIIARFTRPPQKM